MLYGPSDALPDLPLDPPDDERLTAEELQRLREDDADRRLDDEPARQTIPPCD